MGQAAPELAELRPENGAEPEAALADADAVGGNAHADGGRVPRAAVGAAATARVRPPLRTATATAPRAPHHSEPPPKRAGASREHFV
eukprot:CAMPEP_0177365556 /NCGR_PEP_ID=MMETSP0368-20130122/39387_1 /TAXON_ID=447022 ORGANISM="Scrippsiella hangoei-like, Strain SHHI-4" /NCGR_SAMPLE_ID=MMETSP0368 /ASSEMBLY_ACC=CAM_ASM_000363 /LENGTH=86 /DNA_ID=CAMNT_0018828493 /DNA_START=178 /DNA_END=436 /DNA_ORIENTATION=-